MTEARPMPIRAIIADDEPLARRALHRFLAADPAITVVAEAEDVPTLRRVLEETPADVVFLDVTMPGGTSFDALPRVAPGTAVVFTTAHAAHAARAYAVDAVDYLVKPFGGSRVAEALAKVRRFLGATRPDAAAAHLDTILVRVGTRVVPVAVDAIWRLEGADDYVRIIAPGHDLLHGASLSALVARLDPRRFLRVHRRHVINLRHAQRIAPHGDRQLAIVFPDGSRVVTSRAGARVVRSCMRSSG